ILQSKLPGAEIAWSADDGSIAGISVFAMPGRFTDHGIVDAIALITGEAAAIYVWDEAATDFVDLTTTFADAEGVRHVGTRIGVDSPIYASAMAGEAFFGEETILGAPFYTTYQ